MWESTISERGQVRDDNAQLVSNRFENRELERERERAKEGASRKARGTCVTQGARLLLPSLFGLVADRMPN